MKNSRCQRKRRAQRRLDLLDDGLEGLPLFPAVIDPYCEPATCEPALILLKENQRVRLITRPVSSL